MGYTSPSEISRREALLKALAGNQPQVDPRGPVSFTQGLAQVLGSYGARKGQEQLTGMENENQRLQSEDVNNLIRALQSGGMNEKSVTGMNGEPLGTIPRKNYSFQTPEVGNMYAQALMSQQKKPLDMMNVAPGGAIFDPNTNQPIYQAPFKPEAPNLPTGMMMGENGQPAPVPGYVEMQRQIKDNPTPTSLAARPVTVVIDGKPVVMDANTKEIIGDAPAGVNKPLSATAQKELFEAEDVAESGDNAISILKSILQKDPTTGKSQNELAYEGGFPDARLALASVLPGSTESTDASVSLKNKVQGQALESLKGIFGGMPTEGERKILIELQGSLNMTAAQREDVFNRAIALAEKRVKFNRDKAEKLRRGEYFTEQTDTSVPDDSDALIQKYLQGL